VLERIAAETPLDLEACEFFIRDAVLRAGAGILGRVRFCRSLLVCPRCRRAVFPAIRTLGVEEGKIGCVFTQTAFDGEGKPPPHAQNPVPSRRPAPRRTAGHRLPKASSWAQASLRPDASPLSPNASKTPACSGQSTVQTISSRCAAASNPTASKISGNSDKTRTHKNDMHPYRMI